MNLRKSAALFAIAATTLNANSTSAVVITDGTLSVNVDSNGTFNAINLNGSAFQTGNASFGFYIDGNTGASQLVNPSAVAANGASASYSAQTRNGIDASVTVTILGPLVSKPATSNVLEHLIVYANNTAAALPLAVVMGTDPDLSLDLDITEFDPSTRSVVVRDGTTTQLVATIAQDPAGAASFGFDVGIFFPDDVFPLDGNVGPVATEDAATSIGLNYGSLGAGQSVTAVFRHLFDTAATSVPADFTFIPEPNSLALLGLGALTLVRRRTRRSP